MFDDWEAIGWAGGALLVAFALGMILHWVLFRILGRVAPRTDGEMNQSVVRHCRGPMRLILPILALNIVAPYISIPEQLDHFIRHTLQLVMIAGVAWLLISLSYVLDDVLSLKYRIDVSDNLQARRIFTRVRVLRRVVIVIVGVVALGLMLMTFPRVRELGVGMLASAGFAGIIVGLAARPTVETLLAGVQLALTEPIRIDDVVIVEGEWGKIEEITATYVVVRIWDLRRLILPVRYFIDNPFQNWTRKTADILGTVELHMDYTVPVQAVREELERLVKDAPQWDGKVCGLQVTEATERTMRLRALVSAGDASKAWDLRCLVREKLIEFIQKNYPDSLPRVRGELTGADSGESG
ncbi:MAG: mechanosensitive ion channel family protein [Phycisphaeraceae bacterium]|nr:MAG: mechanosensitive ion channel family protein [Phycisphaeraceae bacterium]